MMETLEAELCFPHLPNSSCRKAQTDPTEVLVTNVLLFIASMLTSTLNLLVIIAIAHFRQLHTSTNLILLSLAASDFFVGLVVIPVEGLRWRICWTLGDIMCAIYFVLPMTFFMASVGNIILISVDCYVAICDPLRYQTRVTEKFVSVGISVCWLYALIYSLLFFMENIRNPGKYNPCHGICILYYSKEVDITMGFVVPVSVIILLYLRVLVVAVSQARAMRSQVTALVSRSSKKSEIKAVRKLGIIVLVYLICYCPYFCVVYSETNITILGIPLAVIAYSLIYFNSCLNPLIYTFLYPWFRKTIKVIVTLKILKPGSSNLKIV